MSTASRQRGITIRDIRARKGGEPIVCLTAYSTPMARFLDPHVDLLLVGDSMGNVVYGMETTLGVTLDMMIAHGKAVARGTEHACLIVDLPFGSYKESPQVAYRAGARVMAETGAKGVKLEGGVEMAETIRFLATRGIPVMAHIGLTPQSLHADGGYRAHGREADEATRLMADARAIAEAGAFAVVVEGTVEAVARDITAAIPIPTIGIGASAACDGQILVTEDILGLFADFTPKFVRRYAELGAEVAKAVQAYAEDVRARRFPGPEHLFGPKKPS
ncbi:3-methyl-2-oxobutanoate hydroxymethyltransferase [Shumkonia mesophila]|uniref:3-methyl-2-oxobutanoate hydroxymethyltransferase n=1 Tax=Shumkonia mesophila TaxID=2838854 RepID=UPI002934E62D|nr:3-methyl-2-oxobutanoate hydroxymethyltransferase [Shumkonia mesophila]